MKKLLYLLSLCAVSYSHAQITLEATLQAGAVVYIQESKEVELNTPTSFESDAFVCDVLVEKAPDNQYMIISQVSTLNGSEKVLVAEPVVIVALGEVGEITFPLTTHKSVVSDVTLSFKILKDLSVRSDCQACEACEDCNCEECPGCDGCN